MIFGDITPGGKATLNCYTWWVCPGQTFVYKVDEEDIDFEYFKRQKPEERGIFFTNIYFDIAFLRRR